MKNRLIRIWIYFRTGHGTYLVLTLGFLNFIVLQFRLLVSAIPSLSAFFPHLVYFAVFFIVTYVPLAIILGWMDYKKGSIVMDSVLRAEISPFTLDSVEALILASQGFLAFLDGDLETARENTLKSLEMRKKWRRKK